MRRLLATAIVVMTLFGTSISPSHAVFGLSKCEKVKKDILGLEKQIKDVPLKALGVTYEQVYFTSKQKIWEPTPETVKLMKKVIGNDPIPKIWKLATNNPKCFSNTQKMRIKEMKDITYQTYFAFPINIEKYKNTGECKFLMENNKWEPRDSRYVFTPSKKTQNIKEKCSSGFAETVYFYTAYESIYTY